MLVNISEEKFLKLEEIGKGDGKDIVAVINEMIDEYIDDHILDL